MDKEFVLVSQGMEIMRTKSQENAINYVKKENDEWFDYKQKCIDNHEDYADNYIYLEIEYPEEQLIYKNINELQQKFDNVNEYKKEDLLLDLNYIGKLINEHHFMERYRDLILLYQETFDEPLFANINVEKGE